MKLWIEHDEGIQQLGPRRLELLMECHEAAFATYLRVFRPELPTCSARAMPTILHELIIQEARDRFGGDPQVALVEPDAADRFLLEIDGQDRKVIVQFKKLTADLRTRNNPTRTSLTFDQQELDLGLPPYPRLTAGYRLGAFDTKLSVVYLVFLIGDECIWHHDLRTGEHSGLLQFPQPSGPSVAELERQYTAWEQWKVEKEGST